MKNIIISILIGLVLGVIGFYSGYKKGYQSAENVQMFRSVDEIKVELKAREEEDISSYLKGKASIKKIDEGSWFKSKYVQYFSGQLTNSATLASAKDVILNIDFFSKTGSKMGHQKITIYEFVEPGKTIEFKERINVPGKVEDFKFQIIEVKSE